MLRGSLSSITTGAARSHLGGCSRRTFGTSSSLFWRSPTKGEGLSRAAEIVNGNGQLVPSSAMRTERRIPSSCCSACHKFQQHSHNHPHHQPQQQLQVRPFATSAQKRSMAQQQQRQKKGKSGSSSDNDSTSKAAEADSNSIGDSPKQPPTLPPKTSAQSAAASQPKSLIRTDFALRSSSNNTNPQELILPTGYEIPLTATPGSSSADEDDSGSTPHQASSFSYIDYKELYDPNIHLPSAPQDWSDYEPATPLWEELGAQIGVLGRPMTVAEFMQHALLHPQYGYYSQPMRDRVEGSDTMDDDNHDDDDIFSDDEDNESDGRQVNPIFGPRGDFVTAPEICQVFGESIQVWMVTEWEAMGKPKAVQWVEFGPGRGTLMADMVRFALASHNNQNTNDDAKNKSAGDDAAGNSKKLEEYGNALQVIHLIEPSGPLRQKQQASLQDQLGDLVHWEFHNPVAETPAEATKDSTKPNIQVHWHDSFASLTAMIMRTKQRKMGHESMTENTDQDEADISNMPLFVICQEFFDALPVHAFEMTEDGWRERMVDMAIRDELLEDEDEGGSDSTNNISANKPKPVSPQGKDIDGVKRPRLRIVLAPEVTPALKTLLHVDEDGKILGDPANKNLKAEPGQVCEVCPEGILVAQDIAALLEHQGGAAIVVDYGEEGSTDSLRGFWKHKQTHFLSLPGLTDVTADVDFTALKHAVNHARPNRIQQLWEGDDSGASDDDESDQAATVKKEKKVIKAYGPITQGKFLVSMGAQERVVHHIERDSTSDEEAENLFHALERLVAPEQMGIRYKVLAIAVERHKKEVIGSSYTVPPPGF